MAKTGQRLLTSKNWMFGDKMSQKFKIRRAPISICLPLQQVPILHNIFKIISIVVFKINFNQICFLFLDSEGCLYLEVVVASSSFILLYEYEYICFHSHIFPSFIYFMLWQFLRKKNELKLNNRSLKLEKK